ncbi:discoidin domain-containing protein [Schumannella soli]|uniref:Discoidin domain-containing protein n=1 Tax=Schumannella soli TaxID=2590779 RepID=A0A506XV38_9MICO|nr:discoidin domain-containing protein [Schumannella soli]TPW74006.1 discoidin domain-containing protein [Schumannella soli]
MRPHDSMTATISSPARSRRLSRLLAGVLAIGLAGSLLGLSAAPSAEAAPTGARYGAPDDIAADYYGALLRHTRWTETVWDSTAGVYQLKDFNFAVVLGNAVLLTHGDYDATVTGVPKETLRSKTLATIKHYAAVNRFVDAKGTWGKQLFWDSTFQSYFLDAGRLLWDQLDATTQQNLRTIAVGQSRYTADLEYGDDPRSGSWTTDWPTGKYLGDTAQEETGVYTQALAPGLAWAPDDADAGRWAEQLATYGRNAAGQPTADRNNPAIVAGAPISSNTMHTIHDTYLVENHGSFGPHYQSDIWRSGGRNAIQFLLNDQPLPEILTRQPNSAELWESIKMMMSNQGEPFMPMVPDREYLYGRDVLPLAFLGQVQRDPDAVRAEANLAAALEDYQAYAPVDRLAKFSGEPKYEPEARAEIAISYLLHVHAAQSKEGVVVPTPQADFFARLTGVRDFGSVPGLTVQQTAGAWAAASSHAGFVKFPWVPGHDSWLFDVSGATPFLSPSTSAAVAARSTQVYTAPRDGFEGTASVYGFADHRAGQVTLPTGSAIYATSGGGTDDASLTVRNLKMGGYSGLDGTRDYTTAEGASTASLPVKRPADALDAKAARVDDLDIAPVSARYVRMLGQQGNPTYGYSMYSFHVYGDDPASNVDLAAGAAARASSEDAANRRTASTVTDKDANSRWAVSTADRTRSDSWIQVDLGSSQRIGAVRLAWEASAGSRYLIQTSDDAQSWTTRTAYGKSAADANVARLDTVDLTPPGFAAPAPVTTRYVRMQGVTGDSSYGYSLYHLRAFTPQGVDVAAKRTATASSADPTKPASAVTDGSPSTRWAVASSERSRSDSWVQVDLGAQLDIAQVQLGWESAAGREYRIQTSLDGVTWQDAADFRYTGDQVLSSAGGWIDVDGKAGFVVRGSDAPITVSTENPEQNVLRLADRAGGPTAPLLVEMIPGDAAATRARAAAAAPTSDTAGVIASALDGYLSVFNLTGSDARAVITVPHGAGAIPLFAGTQTVGAASSAVEVSVPAGSAVVLSPRATIETTAARARALAAGANAVTASVSDARSVRVQSAAPVEVVVTNLETGSSRAVSLTSEPQDLAFENATAFPVPDLALSTLTFPASVLPVGMTSPALAVDGDASTAWRPGPDGRMVTDLGAMRQFGAVVTDWGGDEAPAATISVSDDGLTFRDIGTVPAGRRSGTVDGLATARYVALSTSWSEGDADLTALRVLIPQAPAWTSTALPSAKVGDAFVGQLGAVGTPSPTFRLVAGALPDGLRLDESTGRISGTPTAAGDFVVTIGAQNGVGDETQRDVAITVAAADVDPGQPGGGQPGQGAGSGGTGDSGGSGGVGDDSGGGSLANSGVNAALPGLIGLALVIVGIGLASWRRARVRRG